MTRALALRRLIVLCAFCAGLPAAVLSQEATAEPEAVPTDEGEAPAPDAAEGSAIDCSADGYEVLLTNTTAERIEAGRTVAWTVPFVRRTGLYELSEAMDPGESLFISGALGSDYLSASKPCTALVQ